MLNFYSLVVYMFATAVEWRDFSDKINEFYQRTIPNLSEVGFLKVKIINDYWVELDVESTDVESVFLFVTKNNKSGVVDDPYEVSEYFIGGDIGVYRYFNNITCFYNFFKREHYEKDEFVDECKARCERYPLPEVIRIEINKILENRWDNETIKTRLLEVNSRVNAFFCFKYKKRGACECQAQVFVVRKDNTCVATNLMKIKRVNRMLYREGFDNVNRLNFGSPEENEVETEEAITEEYQPQEVLNRVQQTNTQPRQSINEPPQSAEKQKQIKTALGDKKKKLGGLAISMIVISCIIAGILIFVFIRYRSKKE